MEATGVFHHPDEFIPAFAVGASLAHRSRWDCPTGDAWQSMSVFY
jgi:hypothetical protein